MDIDTRYGEEASGMKKRLVLTAVAAFALAVHVPFAAFATGGPEAAAADAGPLKLKILFAGITWTKANLDMNESEELKTWEKLTNTDLTFVTPPWSNYWEKVNLYFASGDLPDVVGTVGPAYIAGLVDTGNVVDLTSYVQGPLGQALIEKTALERQDFAPLTIAGKIYAVPTLQALADASEGFMVRQDWLDKLGLAQPTTLEEYRKVLNAFTYRDPDGNGKNDTYGITGRSNFMYLPVGFMGAFDLWGSPGRVTWEAKNGKVFAQSTQEKYKEFLKYMRALIYDDKVVSPNALFNTSDQWKQEMFGSVVGMWFHSSTRIDEYFMTNMMNANPDWKARGIKLSALIPPLGPNGHGGAQNTFATASGFLFTTALRNPDRAFAYFVRAFTDPVLLDFATYGLEGRHHTVKDGAKVWVADAKKDERLHQVRDLVFLESKYPINDELVAFTWGERALESYKINKRYNLPVNTDFVGKPVLEEEKTYANLDSTQLEYTMKIVSGKLDLEAGWLQMQQALKDGGLEKVQAAYQKWYDTKAK